MEQTEGDDDPDFIPGVTSLNYNITVEVDRSKGLSKAVSEGMLFIPSIVESLKGREIQLRRLIEKISEQDDHFSRFNAELKKFGVGEDDFYESDCKNDIEMVKKFEDLLQQLKETRRKAERCKGQLETLKLEGS